MLTISSTIPAAEATNVLRDASIDIIFSKEVKTASLTIVNFVIYRMDGGTPVEQVAIGLNKTGTTVKIAPAVDLLANTGYTVLILGDQDLSDVIDSGVVAIDNDTMDGNHTFVFTTGEMRHIDVVGGADPGDSSTVSGQIDLAVVSTDPVDYESQVNSLPTITVDFDRYMTAISGETPFVIESRALVFGETPDLPGVASLSYSSDHKSLIGNISGTITSNTEYHVTVDKNAVSGSLDTWLPVSHCFRFFTQMHPYYTDPGTVRQRGGHFISPTIDDWLINMYILDASILVSDELEVGFLSGSSITRNITRLTTCIVISEIAHGIADGSLKGISSKALADLKIEYDYRGAMAAIGRIDQCIDDMQNTLGAGSIQTGVKSGDSGHYPGRRRVIWAE